MSVGYESPVRLALKECRPLFWAAFWFGLVINLLVLAIPLFSLQVLDRVLSSGSHDTLLLLTFIAGVALVFMGMMEGLRALMFSHVGRWLDDRLSNDIVERTVHLALHNPRVGSQPQRDLNTVRSFITSPNLGKLFDAPWAAIYFAVIYAIHIKLGIAVTLGASVLLTLAIVAERLPSTALAAANDEQIKSMQSLDSIIRNAEVVKSMGLLAHATDKWRHHNQQHLGHTFSSGNITTVISQITRTLRLSMQIMMICLGAYLALSDQMSPGSIVAVSILTGRALTPFDAAIPLYKSVGGLRKALTRLFSLEETAQRVGQTMILPEPKGQVTIQNATFEASAAKRWILKGISIEVEPGEAVGVIGPSGSGKTTFARLLVGVAAPTTGAICLDGAALHQWDPAQLGRTIGYLPQDVELFDGTIAENIARLDPQADDQAVIEAAQNAQIHDTILAFPQGYRTDIGANGSLLSAGQRQRVALARCFYGNPKLIVMDEPNSNLDGEGEIAFVKAVNRAKELGITTVTIAHRPSVLQSVDKVLVLQNGETKLFGPTHEVMAELANGNANVQPIQKMPMKG